MTRAPERPGAQSEGRRTTALLGHHQEAARLAYQFAEGEMSNPKIKLTDKIKAMAAEVEMLILHNLKKEHGHHDQNYTKLTVDRRYYLGMLGEFSLAEWLRCEGVRFEHRVNTSGHSAPSEFIIAGARVECKTGSEPYYKRLMFPAAQAIDFDRVIGVRLNRGIGEAEVMGSALAANARLWPVGRFGDYDVDTRWCLYEKLIPASLTIMVLR